MNKPQGATLGEVRRSFLTQLGRYAREHRQEENQLSETFSACFNRSPHFRACVLDAIRPQLRSRKVLPDAEHWHCRTQQFFAGGIGIVDLVLQAALPTGSSVHAPVMIAIESKVSARLEASQLARYKQQFKFVVAMCKRRPELSHAERTQIGVAYIPWQEIHRSLGNTRTRDPLARFLAAEFRTFLEDYGMAHTTVRVADFIRVQKTFASIDGDVGNSSVSVLALEEANAILSLAGELLDEWRDRAEGFTSRRVWGPGYYKEDYEDDAGVVHQLGFTVYSSKGAGCKDWVEFYFTFPKDSGELPYVWVGRCKESSEEMSDYKQWSIDSLADKESRVTRSKLAEKVLPALLEAHSNLPKG